MRSLALLPLFVLSAPALAQEADSGQADSAPNARDIVVTAPRIPGQLDVPQPPIVTLDEADIAAYGVGSLTELLAALTPQTGSGRGRGGGPPAILFNGQRISSFREFRNIPPEAIRRVEVLPEEVALRFGFPPNQRVVNFILRDNFAARSFDLEYEMPERGGFARSEFEASLLKISKASRLNLNVQIEDTTMLTEAERALRQPVGAIPAAAEARSLVADSRDMALTGSWSTGLGKGGQGGSLSANLSLTRNDTRSLSGLDVTLTNPLERRSRTVGLLGGAAFNKGLGEWQLTATLDGSLANTATEIDRTTTGTDLALTRNSSATALTTLNGRPIRMPAGEAALTLKAGYAATGIVSEDTRSGLGEVTLNRGDVSGGINLFLPLTSRRENVLGALGELGLNLGLGLNQFSDFGTLTDWNAGLSWSPTEKLRLQASYFVNQAPPSLGDLGNPLTVSFNVPVYDFTRGESVLVSLGSGGNPALLRETQRDIKFSANWEMPLKGSSLMAEYFRNRSDNVTAAFPLLTPAIEAAFPGRATRDGTGRLIAIDRRPVTLAETRGERLRWGLNISGSIGKAAPGGGPLAGVMGRPGGGGGGGGRPPGGGPPGARPPGGGGGGGGGPPMAAFFGGGGQGRWNLSAYHTWRFSEQVLIAPGGPLLDLLNGDALTGGGVARHSLELDTGVFHKGIGFRLGGSWTAPTTLKASGLPGTSDLRFGSVFRLDLRTFINFDQQKRLIKQVPFLKGSRLSFVVDNVLDSRQRVTDASGAVPLSYQPDYLDPRGRYWGIDFRKVF